MPFGSLLSDLNRRPRLVFALTLVIGVAFMALFTALLARPEFHTADSPGYLNWSILRTPGYPLVLSLVRMVDPTLGVLPYLQMAVFVISTAVLMQACHRVRPAAWLWTATGAAIVANPFLWRYAWTIMTDSLYSSSCMVFLACMAMALRPSPDRVRWLGLSGAVLGIAIMLRPSAYALLAASVVGVLLWLRPRIKLAAVLVAPALACVLLASAWNWSARGFFGTQVFAGYSLMGQAAFLVRPHEGDPHAALTARIVAELKPVADRLPQPFTQWSNYYWLVSEGYNHALWQIIVPDLDAEVTRASAASGEELSENGKIQRINALAHDIALSAIRRDPVGYAWQAAVNFVGLWLLPAISSAEESQRVAALLCAPKSAGFFFCSDHRFQARIIVGKGVETAKEIALLLLMVLALSMPLAAVIFGQKYSLLILGAVAALCIDANHALVALTVPGIPRYAIEMWPLLCVMTMCAGLVAVELIRRPGKPFFGFVAGR